MLDVPAPQILAAQKALNRPRYKGDSGGWRASSRSTRAAYGPIVDGDLLPHHPFDPTAPASAADKPLIDRLAGQRGGVLRLDLKDVEAFRLDEAGLKARLAGGSATRPRSLIDTYRGRPSRRDAQRHLPGRLQLLRDGRGLGGHRRAQGRPGPAPVYVYNIAYRSNRKMDGTDIELGAMHASDIPLVFNTVASPTTLAGDRADRFEAARNISTMWANFARTGQPSAPGQPAWPAYDLKTRSTMVLDVKCSGGPGPVRGGAEAVGEDGSGGERDPAPLCHPGQARSAPIRDRPETLSSGGDVPGLRFATPGMTTVGIGAYRSFSLLNAAAAFTSWM